MLRVDLPTPKNTQIIIQIKLHKHTTTTDYEKTMSIYKVLKVPKIYCRDLKTRPKASFENSPISLS